MRAQYVALLRFFLFGACLCSSLSLDGMQTPPGITKGNQSYFSGNTFSVPHSAQQLQNDTPATLVQPLASIQEVDAPASSGVISSSLLSCSAFSSQVTVAPTRFGTRSVIPLAEAITQLSFLEFLQRCGVSIVPHQPSRPPVSITLRDATVQTTPLCDVSHQVSTQTAVQQDTLSCDVAVQTSFYGVHTFSLDAAAQTTSPSTLSQHVSTQMGSRAASSFSVDTSVQTPRRCVVQHDAATQLDLTEFLIGWISSDKPVDRRHPFCQSPPSILGALVAHLLAGFEQPALLPILLSQSTSHTGAHLMQPRSEAYEIEDRCFRVSVARRLMLPHPVAANPADVVQFCPNRSAAGVICNKASRSETASLLWLPTDQMSCGHHSITQWGQSIY